MQPSASRARQAARLLVGLRALMRQPRCVALLGCCLHLIERLSACLQHLDALPRSAKPDTNIIGTGAGCTADHQTYMPRAAACMACKAASPTACCTQSLPNADSNPIAAHAQPAARLRDKLRALMLQRRGKARLGCRLRLGARLGAHFAHLSDVAIACHQEGMANHCGDIPQ